MMSDKALLLMNLLAAAAIFVSMGERLSWAGYETEEQTDEIKDILNSKEYTENTSGFYYILVAFICIFTLLLVLAEFRSLWARSTFSFLETKVGRGIFIIFIALMIPQTNNGVSIAMSVIANLIGFFNVIVGWD